MVRQEPLHAKAPPKHIPHHPICGIVDAVEPEELEVVTGEGEWGRLFGMQDEASVMAYILNKPYITIMPISNVNLKRKRTSERKPGRGLRRNDFQ